MTLALVSFASMVLDSNNPMFDPNNQHNMGAFYALISTFWFIFLIIFIFQMYCYWRIATKSGYPGSYSLLLLIPLVNIIVSLMWIFSEWPIEAELKRCREQAATQRLP